MDMYRQRCEITADELVKRYGEGQRSFDYIELPENSSLCGAVLDGVIFQCSWIYLVDFREADLRNASFIESNVKVSDFRGADLREGSFRGCVICGSVFKGAKLDNVVMDDTTYYGWPVEDIRDLENTDLKVE